MVSLTNLVSHFSLVHHQPEKKTFQKLIKKSSAIPASWMVPGHCGMIVGQGGVVWVTLSGQEGSYDLFES